MSRSATTRRRLGQRHVLLVHSRGLHFLLSRGTLRTLMWGLEENASALTVLCMNENRHLRPIQVLSLSLRPETVLNSLSSTTQFRGRGVRASSAADGSQVAPEGRPVEPPAEATPAPLNDAP